MSSIFDILVILLLLWSLLVEYKQARKAGHAPQLIYLFFFIATIALLASVRFRYEVYMPTVYVVRYIAPWIKSIIPS